MNIKKIKLLTCELNELYRINSHVNNLIFFMFIRLRFDSFFFFFFFFFVSLRYE